jgi:hypothetical protein
MAAVAVFQMRTSCLARFFSSLIRFALGEDAVLDRFECGHLLCFEIISATIVHTCGNLKTEKLLWGEQRGLPGRLSVRN